MTQIFRPTASSSSVQWNWFTLIGPDAQDFLHRVTTAHVRALPVGKGSPGCFLNAQGKIRAYFTLWNFDADSYAFEFDAGASGKWKNDLLAAVDQYTFAEKMTLTDATPQLESCWIFPSEEDLVRLDLSHLTPGSTIALDEEIRVCHHGSLDYGKPWMTCWGRPARLSQWLEQKFPEGKSIHFEEIETWRILALRPKVDQEITESSIPLEIGLRDSISDNKGCYPGQEVIEKIVALGSPPKRLALIQGEGSPPQLGEKIFNLADNPSEVGQITSVTSSNGKFFALGLVRKIHAKEGLEVQFTEKSKSRGTVIQISAYAD